MLMGKEYGTGNWWEVSHAYILKPAGAKKLIDWTMSFGAFPSDVIIGTKVLNIDFNTDGLIVLNKESKTFSLTKPETF